MSHSYKHTPIIGYTCAETEKLDKRIWNSRLRAHERDRLKQIRLYRDYSDQEKIVSRLEGGDEYCECWLCNYGINFYEHDGGDHLTTLLREVSSVWEGAKDGKMYCSPKSPNFDPKWIRK